MDLKGQCVDLLFDCPREGEESGGKRKGAQTADGRLQTTDCPFRKVRELDVVERVKWLKGLSMEELRGLVAYHGECRQRGKETLSRDELRSLGLIATVEKVA
jgi:hypothetical protein